MSARDDARAALKTATLSKLETEKSINMVEMSTLAVSDKLWAQRLQIIIKFGKEFGKRAKQDQFVIIHTI